jgi:hypothetical protein
MKLVMVTMETKERAVHAFVCSPGPSSEITVEGSRSSGYYDELHQLLKSYFVYVTV